MIYSKLYGKLSLVVFAAAMMPSAVDAWPSFSTMVAGGVALLSRHGVRQESPAAGCSSVSEMSGDWVIVNGAVSAATPEVRASAVSAVKPVWSLDGNPKNDPALKVLGYDVCNRPDPSKDSSLNGWTVVEQSKVQVPAKAFSNVPLSVRVKHALLPTYQRAYNAIGAVDGVVAAVQETKKETCDAVDAVKAAAGDVKVAAVNVVEDVRAVVDTSRKVASGVSQLQLACLLHNAAMSMNPQIGPDMRDLTSMMLMQSLSPLVAVGMQNVTDNFLPCLRSLPKLASDTVHVAKACVKVGAEITKGSTAIWKAVSPLMPSSVQEKVQSWVDGPGLRDRAGDISKKALGVAANWGIGKVCGPMVNGVVGLIPQQTKDSYIAKGLSCANSGLSRARSGVSRFAFR